jgi:formylglycine-generating enzyme required for sulfatase activity
MLRNLQPTVGLTILVLLSLAMLSVENLPAQSAQAAEDGEMALIPAGIYRPLFRAATEEGQVSVRAFQLDKFPVTTGEFLQFVRANPSWRRSQIKPIFADGDYLKNWSADLEPGTNASLNAPVTYVSWFAARAYAQWKGKRLATVAEWEYAASAGFTRPDGENDAGFRSQILRWYTTLGTAPGPVGASQPNFWGVHALHGWIWEWVLDFNGAMVTGDSRADTGGLERGLFCGAGAQSARDVANYPAFMRVGFRSSLSATYCIHNLGFRCAKDL